MSFKKLTSCLLAALYLAVFNTAGADILVNRLNDIEASATPGRQNDLVLDERLCVGSNPPGPYSLQALGSGVNGGFSIHSGPHSLSYNAYIRDQFSRGSFNQLIAGTPLTGLQGRALNPNNRCRGNTTTLRVEFTKEALSSAVAGIYTGTMIITVIPE